jgi:hypothetical protein
VSTEQPNELQVKPQEEDQPGLDRDGFLEILIHAVEHIPAPAEGGQPETLDITLNVGGILITGTLVSRETFIQAVPTMKATVGALDEKMTKEDREARDKRYDRHYIHLTNARFIFADGRTIPGNAGKGIEWRGRLNRVDGWTIGRFLPASQLESEGSEA